MVMGLDVFAEAFEDLDDQYVLIGGAAADLWFTGAGLDFRATQDLDLVLCVDILGAGFVERFWAFVEQGRYQLKERADGTPIKYRFTKPAQAGFPKMLELFAAAPFEIPTEQDIVPLSVDDEHSSLSAILLDDGYREVVLGSRKVIERVMCLTPHGLILLKARAWLDLTERKANGDDVDSSDIRKHRNDVFSIAQLLVAGEDPEVPASVLADMGQFVREMDEQRAEWSAVEASLRAKNMPLNDVGQLIDIMRSHFGLLGQS